MKLIWIAPCILLGAWQAAPGATGVPQSTAACVAAESYIAGMVSKPNPNIAFYAPDSGDDPVARQDDGLEKNLEALAKGDWEFSPSIGRPLQPPSGDVAKAMAAANSINAVSHCANVRAMLEKRHVVYVTNSQVRAQLGPNIHVIRISLPVLSADGADGLVIYEDALRVVQHLKKQPTGEWISIRNVVIAIDFTTVR